jgi:hypothetical protein
VMRSCYTSKMRFVEGGPLVPIVWLKARASAPFLGFPTCFNSNNWSDQNDPTYAIGEVTPPRPWSNGSNFGAPDGSNTCGNDEDLEDGPSGPYDPPRMVNQNGWPMCCDPPDVNRCWVPSLPALHGSGSGVDPFTVTRTGTAQWAGDTSQYVFLNFQIDCHGDNNGPRFRANAFTSPIFEDQPLVSWDGEAVATFEWTGTKGGYPPGTLITLSP